MFSCERVLNFNPFVFATYLKGPAELVIIFCNKGLLYSKPIYGRP